MTDTVLPVTPTRPSQTSTLTETYSTNLTNSSGDSINTSNSITVPGTASTFITASSPSHLINPYDSSLMKANASSQSLNDPIVNQDKRLDTDNISKTQPQSLQTSPQVKPASGGLIAPQRPLSRSSMTSCLSTTATKDGIEGKRIKKHGIPGYPLRLINKMYSDHNPGVINSKNLLLNNNGVTDSGSPSRDQVSNYSYTGASHISKEEDYDSDIHPDEEDVGSLYSVKSLSSMIPQYSKDDLVMSLHDGESREERDIDSMDVDGAGSCSASYNRNVLESAGINV